MARKCEKLNLEEFKDQYIQSFKMTVEIYIDLKNKDEINKYLAKYINKARRAFYYVLKGNYNNDIYGKAEVSSNTKNIKAIKIIKGKMENIRIYCKEYFYPNDSKLEKKVVLMAVYHKKSTSYTKKNKKFIEKLGKYEYEFE